MRLQLISICFLLLAGISRGAGAQKQPVDAMYSRFPARGALTGKSAMPELRTHQAREYRTRLRAAAAAGPNFAGHYDLALWGCGSSCVSFAVIDAKTGKVTFFPFTVSQTDEVGEDLGFRRDSRALHAIGSLNEGKNSADRWYVWTGSGFRLVSEKPSTLEDTHEDPREGKDL